MTKFFSLSLSISLFVFAFGSSASAQSAPPKQVNGGVLNGKALSLPKPVYPDAARAAKASGTVKVRVTIDEAGNVISAEAVSGNELLRDVSVEAAKAAKFSPTLLSGKPVRVSGVIDYNFVASQPGQQTLSTKGLLSEVPIEDRDKLWIVGALFALIDAADAETLRTIGVEKELNDLLKDLSSSVTPATIEYKTTIEKLGSPDASVRTEGAKEFLVIARKEFNAEQNWQVDAGEQIGLIFAELIRQKAINVKTGAAFDVNILRTRLSRLSDIVVTAPKDASPDLKARLEKIAAFRDVANLGTQAQIEAMVDAMSPLFEELEN